MENFLKFPLFQWKAALSPVWRPRSTNTFAQIWSICCPWASWPLGPTASTIATDPIRTSSPLCRYIATFARRTIWPPMRCRSQWECPTTLTERYVVHRLLWPDYTHDISFFRSKWAAALYALAQLFLDIGPPRQSEAWIARGMRSLSLSCSACSASILCGFLAQLVVIVVPTPHTVASQWRPMADDIWL